MKQQTQRTFARANFLRICRSCCGLDTGKVANLLRTCYGETGVMDFGRNAASFNSRQTRWIQ